MKHKKITNLMFFTMLLLLSPVMINAATGLEPVGIVTSSSQLGLDSAQTVLEMVLYPFQTVLGIFINTYTKLSFG